MSPLEYSIVAGVLCVATLIMTWDFLPVDSRAPFENKMHVGPHVLVEKSVDPESRHYHNHKRIESYWKCKYCGRSWPEANADWFRRNDCEEFEVYK